MKKTVSKFGGYGLLTAVILFLLVLWFGKGLDFSAQEILGYLTIVTSLSFTFFGIKHFRDNVNNGVITLGKALIIGILISLLVALGFAIADYIYTSSINPDFISEYMDYTLKEMKETLSVSEFETQKAILEKQMETMGTPFLMACIMFVTVVIIGFIVSLISGLILQRK